MRQDQDDTYILYACVHEINMMLCKYGSRTIACSSIIVLYLMGIYKENTTPVPKFGPIFSFSFIPQNLSYFTFDHF